MREKIERLIKSGITAYRVSQETDIAQNTATRIFNRNTQLDNVALRNAEILAKYYDEKEVEIMNALYKKMIENGEADYWTEEENWHFDFKETYVPPRTMLGLDEVLIVRHEPEEESDFFAVYVQEYPELSYVRDGHDKFVEIASSYSSHDLDEAEYIEAFATMEEAVSFAEAKYPKIDVATAAKSYFENSDDEEDDE